MKTMANDQIFTTSSRSIRNRIRLRAKKESQILVEGWDDKEFVKKTLRSKEEIRVVICDGKDNLIYIASEISSANNQYQDTFSLIDLDYDWVHEERRDYLGYEHLFTYTAHSLESFEFYFANASYIDQSLAAHPRSNEFQYAIDCALTLGSIRAWNEWKEKGIRFNTNKDRIDQIYLKNKKDNMNTNQFRNEILNLFGLGPNFYTNTLSPHLQDRAPDDSYVIHGKDLKRFFEMSDGSSVHSDISKHGLAERVLTSELHADFQAANLVETLSAEE
jgi:phosphotransferase system IIB component